MMEFMPKIVDYIALVDTRQTSDSVDIQKLAEKLKEISRDWKVEIVSADNTDWFDRIDNGDSFEYCLQDIQAQRSFCDHIHNLERIERRRRLRHVPRGQRNKEPQRRKAYRGKRRLPTETSVQLLERDFISFRVLKNRTGQEGMAAFEPISEGRPLGKISLFHGR